MKKKFGNGTIEVERVYSGGGQGYDSSGRYYGTGLPVYAVTYEDNERDPYTGHHGREFTVQVRARSISEAIEAAGDEISRRLRIPRGEWGSKSTRRNQTRARESGRHRGIYHEFDINEGDYVIRSHHRGGFVVDRVGRGGTHTTIGPTKGYSTARDALMEAARDSHVQGNRYGAVFLSDGDDVTQIGHIENGRFRGGGSDSIADVERFVARKLSKSQPRESRRERSGASRTRRHSRVREEDNESPLIRISYTRITPGDSDDPDDYEEDHGWIDEDGVEFEPDEYDIEEGMTPSESIVEQAAKFLKDEYAVNPSSAPGFHPGIWYSTEYETIDYGTGEQEERSFHLKGFTPDQEQAIWREVTGGRR